jgi:N-acetylglucosaminyldiphosphoundecaprenol N-acetyl-beta-D-mannosaminyltransferase
VAEIPQVLTELPSRFDVAGVQISAVQLDQAAELIVRAARQRMGGYVCVTGAHGVVECQRDPRLKDIHNASWLTVPDGMPLVWLARLRKVPLVGRVYGPDLMRKVLMWSSAPPSAPDIAAGTPGLRHGFVGSTPDVLQALEHRVRAMYPHATIAGSWPLPFRVLTGDEWTALLSAVHIARVELLWVGMSTPKQEQFMAEWHRRWPDHAPTEPSPVLVGVGAAFDILAGIRTDAPRWIQRSGLQWLYRLLQEPRRLGPRYLRVVPTFLWLALRSLWSSRSRPSR